MSIQNRNALLYSTIVAIGGFIFGLDAALISGTVNYIGAEFGLNDLQVGTAVSAPALGVLLALPFAGYACDALGRKKTLQIVAILYLFSAVASAFATSFTMLVVARFIGDLAFSSISLASMYIGEIAPAKLRGKLVSMTQINIVVGLSTAYFINFIIVHYTKTEAAWVIDLGLKADTWRWMLGSEIIPAFVWLGLLMLIPESPVWQLSKGQTAQAEFTLMKIVEPTEVQDQIKKSQQVLAAGRGTLSIVEQLNRIFSKPMRNIFIIALTIAIAQQSTGINAILFYAPTVFEQLGVGSDASFVQAIWVGLTSVVFTILAIFLVDRIGRRPMIIWGMLWIIASLGICSYGFSIATYSLDREQISSMKPVAEKERLFDISENVYPSDIAFKQAVIEVLGEAEARKHSSLLLQKAANLNTVLILFGLLSFIGAFHFSIGPIMWVLFSEIFPVDIRGIAIPFFTIITSLTNYLVQQFFPWQLANLGMSTTILFYAITVAIGLVILYKYLKETKNLSIEEVQMLFK